MSGNNPKGVFLLVDDDPDILSLLEATFQARGATVFTAIDVEQAKKILSEQEIDIVISDIHMPGLSGLDLLAILRKDRPDVGVVMATSDTEVANAVDAFKWGADDYLIKPFNMDEALPRIENVRERYRLKKENKEYQLYLERKVEERTKRLRQEHKRLQELFLHTIQALASALEAKDKYTRGHSERVARWAVMIAKAMGLPDVDINDIRVAGVLHDVGKIGVKESILNKPAKLTQEEYEHIKQHPVLSAKILAPIPELAKVSSYVKHHHERWDGRGYPDKLKGDEIPLGARILHVADSYDTMAFDRIYRKALTRETVIQDLESNAGKQFDPDVIKAFVKILEDEL